MSIVRTGSLVGAVALGLCTGCGGTTAVGSGKAATEERPVAAFDVVELYGVGHVTVRKGDKPALKVRADDNMLTHVKSEVRGRVLRVGVGPGNYTWRTGYPEMEVTAATLKGVKLSGQTRLTAEGVEAGEFTVEADGQCSVTLTGRAEAQTYLLEGQCTCDARKLAGKAATVRCVRDKADCKVLLADVQEVRGELAGMSAIEYDGTPAVLDVKTRDQAKVAGRR